jgi:hypothetical protein
VRIAARVSGRVERELAFLNQAGRASSFSSRVLVSLPYRAPLGAQAFAETGLHAAVRPRATESTAAYSAYSK